MFKANPPQEDIVALPTLPVSTPGYALLCSWKWLLHWPAKFEKQPAAGAAARLFDPANVGS